MVAAEMALARLFARALSSILQPAIMREPAEARQNKPFHLIA